MIAKLKEELVGAIEVFLLLELLFKGSECPFAQLYKTTLTRTFLGYAHSVSAKAGNQEQ